MEKEVKKEEVRNVNTNDANQKWGFSILGISIWKIFAYFIIYSIIRIYYRNIIWNSHKRGVGELDKAFYMDLFVQYMG